jgi:PAS domain S-box-containing protein
MNIMTTARRPMAGAELLAAAFDSLSDAVLVFDAEDRLALWNSRLREVAPGLDEEIEVGMPMDEVGARLDAFDDGGLVRHCRRGVNNLMVLEVRRMSEGGRRERRLRHSERRWRDIAESLADWVWESDAQTRLTYLSDGFCRIIGDACRGGKAQGCVRCLSGEGDAWARHLETVPAAAPFRDLRIKLLVGGVEHHFSISGKPVFDFDGSFVGYRGTGCEITAQIRREEAGEQSRARLMSAIENLTHGLALFDEADRLILCNERFRTSLPQASEGFAPGTAFIDIARRFGESWMDDPAEIERWVKERMECHRLGLTHERRYPDGRWLLVKDVRLKDGSTVVTRTDITELKRREQAVRDSEARFRAVFQHAAIGIAVIQPGGRITQSNQAIEAMLGYSALELAQLRYTDLVHPEHLEQESQLARELIADQIDHYQLETRYIRNGGRVFWAHVTVSIVRGDGCDRFAILMIEDIDKRKRAEAESSMFRAVVEASAEAIAILSPDGRPIFVNTAHERLFGEENSTPDPIGYQHHYSESSRETLRREVVPSLRRGDSWEGVLEARDASGRTFPLWQRAGVVRGATNRPRVYFAFMHDHTSQQQVQDELFKAKEAAEEANVAKTRFLAAASHDLRQPLQALSMFVEVLSNRNHNPQDAALISRICDSVNAVESLLNGLLDVSKLEAGLVVPVPTAFSLAPMFERLAGEFEPLVAAEGLDLRVVHSRLMVKSDPALLERILRNLLSNAVRYTQKGRILFGCRRAGDMLRIEICDTGIGIPTSQIKAIFREFHQLGNPGRDRRQGLGLGLAIVERLARLLSHRIDVRSEPGKGSVFSISVPFAVATEVMCEPRQLNLGISRRNAAIVVVEDEPDVLESTRLLLESWGHTVITALDCESALKKLPSLGQVPDLILADYRLQNAATGGQAISRIRSRLKLPIPAIILTGDTAPERLRQAKASGHGLLHKPVQPAALRQMIDELLIRTPVASRA